MGCFDVMCSVSGMPIKYRQKALLMFCAENPESYSINHGPLQYWQPFTFPIKGIYNDYGSLEKIERDWKVEILEEYFGCPIEAILEFSYHYQSREDVYKYSRHDNVLAFIGSRAKSSYNLDSKEDLISLGFEFISDEDFIHPVLERNINRDALKDSYKCSYSFKLKDGKITTIAKGETLKDSIWMKPFQIDREIRDYAGLNEVWGRLLYCGRSAEDEDWWLGMTKEQTKKYIQLNGIQRMFIDSDVWDFVTKTNSNEVLYAEQSWTKSQKYRLKELFDKCVVPPPSEEEIKNDSFARWKHNDRLRSNCHRMALKGFQDIYYPSIISEKIKKDEVFNEVVKITNVVDALHNTCRYLMPTGHSFEQHNDLNSKLYYEKQFMKILEKNIEDENS